MKTCCDKTVPISRRKAASKKKHAANQFCHEFLFVRDSFIFEERCMSEDAFVCWNQKSRHANISEAALLFIYRQILYKFKE